MQSIEACAAQAHLLHLLDDVARGARITIMKHGQPVAMLVPASPTRSQATAELIAVLRALRKGKQLGATSIRELINEGRRY